MTFTSPYGVFPATGMQCPYCRRQPRLLRRDDDAPGRPVAPAFYVCACGFIAEIGVGPVVGSEPTRNLDVSIGLVE